MPVKRRTCPSTFTPHVVLSALRANRSELEGSLALIRESSVSKLFEVDFELTSDRSALHKYAGLLTSMLLRNSSGILRKLTVRQGL